MATDTKDTATDVAAYLADWIPTLQRAVDDDTTWTAVVAFNGDRLVLSLTTGYYEHLLDEVS